MLSLYTALQTLVFTTVDRIKSQEKGASAVEYALLVAGIATVVVAAVALFGPKLNALFTNIDVDGVQ
ncbi:pilus assembly protein Flp/PilA [Blastococcus aggregatus]|uniref:Pilus assembly protein Flp/PilA n=1 Tax=Blastococcus aggregatus TaxID=38502 RepID=A0A285V9S3_9ACTN|nr:Flp family type IVb pilin [Blastococcus aggregatus]SOC50865.1 pilus assembly protein Flp/PilA [Blastococcus aggregatus]